MNPGIDLHRDQYRSNTSGRAPDGRAVMQQLGWRGCGAACESMIRADHRIEIVLDELSWSEDSAKLRDPYHGWAITTTANALLQRGPGDFILISHQSGSLGLKKR